MIGKTAYRYVHKQIAWSQAHYDCADWYKSRGRYDSALTEYRAVAKVIPYSYVPHMYVGDMYRLMNQPDSAVNAYARAFQAQNSPFVHVRLGMLYFERENIGKAIAEFETTLSPAGTDGEPLDVKASSMARFFLGAAYGKSGNIALAKSNLQTALQLNPNNMEAKKMLDQLR
jgi:tetratricopeptide (TPR) repeat protein